ncbi:MAG TPA: serine hydrolase domain-containing protein [Rectinemataceae bacterium]|nr:serine hydrolase domain-containing protein [Rectinemataceae bacterium]
MKALLLLIPMLLLGCQSLRFRDPVKPASEIARDPAGLDARVLGGMEKYGVEKTSIALIARNKIVYEQGYNVDPGELLQAASISKVLTAYAALQLVEQGKLELDRPLDAYLKESYFPDGSAGRRITLRMVLTHTCGMGNDIRGKDRTIYHEPGKSFHYSGAGFIFLMTVMEELVGMPFDQYMESRVMKPLGMEHSRFSIDYPSGFRSVSAASSLRSSAGELALFFEELLSPRFLSSGLAKAMLSDAVRIDGHYSWGLGIGIQHAEGSTAIWHWGNNADVYHSLALCFLEEGTGIVVMTKGKQGPLLYQDLAHYALGGSYFGLGSTVIRKTR